MAKNTGHGHRIGAVTDRFQIFNPATRLYTVISRSTGKILRNQKMGPAKGITLRTPKRSGGRF